MLRNRHPWRGRFCLQGTQPCPTHRNPSQGIQQGNGIHDGDGVVLICNRQGKAIARQVRIRHSIPYPTGINHLKSIGLSAFHRF